MKFAFSTEICPEWDFPTIAAKAREYGYDGVELSGAAKAAAPGLLTLDDRAGNLEVLGAFTSAGIDMACIAAPVRLTGDRRGDGPNAEALRRWIDLAAELTCRQVMVRDPEPRRGVSGAAAGMALGEWLVPSADHALNRGITLVVCNDATLTSARLMWTMLERLRHPAIACCWEIHDCVGARSAGSKAANHFENTARTPLPQKNPIFSSQVCESPAVSVPTLNSQIRYARVVAAPARPSPIPREPGSSCDVQLFVTRLRGIGYDGYVTAAGAPLEVAGSVLSLPAASVPGVSLPAVRVSNPSNPSNEIDGYLKEILAILKKWGAPAPAITRRQQETRPKAG